MDDDQNVRKARRDSRKVPRIDRSALPHYSTLEEDPRDYWRLVGRDKQVGREQCIAEGRHDFVRSPPRTWERRSGKSVIRYTIFCGRCGAYGGVVGDDD